MGKQRRRVADAVTWCGCRAPGSIGADNDGWEKVTGEVYWNGQSRVKKVIR